MATRQMAAASGDAREQRQELSAVVPQMPGVLVEARGRAGLLATVASGLGQAWKSPLLTLMGAGTACPPPSEKTSPSAGHLETP